MNRQLITLQDINTLARPCTADADLADAFIAEAQRSDVRPRLGDAIYLQLATAGANTQVQFLRDGGANTQVQFLRDGGTWTDSDGRQHLLIGVKTALAYYALARITRDGNIQATRYGAVVKDENYSAEAENAERNRQYRELFAQADDYMTECLEYIDAHRDAFPDCRRASTRTSNRMTIRVIKKI